MGGITAANQSPMDQPEVAPLNLNSQNWTDLNDDMNVWQKKNILHLETEDNFQFDGNKMSNGIIKF